MSKKADRTYDDDVKELYAIMASAETRDVPPREIRELVAATVEISNRISHRNSSASSSRNNNASQLEQCNFEPSTSERVLAPPHQATKILALPANQGDSDRNENTAPRTAPTADPEGEERTHKRIPKWMACILIITSILGLILLPLKPLAIIYKQREER